MWLEFCIFLRCYNNVLTLRHLSLKVYFEHDRQSMYNARLRSDGVTMVAVGKQ